MLDRLAGGPAKVTDLAAPFAMALPSASKHIRVLEQAGLVRRAIDGRVHRCTLDPAALEVVETWLAGNRRLWRATPQSLARFAEDGGEGG
ncbi:MAG: ArsR family transcriptional regulator [Alphaproteobacteria bacterium]